MNILSADVFLGVPFNIASYAMLLHIMVRCAGSKYAAGDFIHTFGDVHVYNNHVDQVREQLARNPLKGPSITLNMPTANPWDFAADHVILKNYESHGAIKAPVAV